MKKIKEILACVTDDSLTIWDYTLFLVIAIFCGITFEHTDLIHTAACSYGFTNGHFLDFYDYVAEFDINPGYMPTVYLLFAIWNLPIRLLGIVHVPTLDLGLIPLMWAKILPCLAFLACGWVTYQICLTMGMTSGRAKLCMYATLTCPIGIYGQFIFGQYDSLMLLCCLLGFLFYLKDKDLWFVVCFAVAVTIKYTALLLFIPLLVLKEKNIWKIAVACVGAMLLFGLEYLAYHGSPAFAENVFGVGNYDGPSGYIFHTGLSIGFTLSGIDYQVNLIIVIFALICAWAYFTKTETMEQLAQWAVFLCCLSLFNIFGLCKYHPQWLVLAVPFWVISAFLNRNTKIFMIVDIAFMLFFVAFHVQMIPNAVDQALMNQGVLKYALPNQAIGTELTMGDLFSSLSPELCLSFNTAIMLVYALFKHPKYCIADIKQDVEPMMGWLRTRLVAGTAIFVVPAFACFAANFSAPELAFSSGGTTMLVSDLSRGGEVSQRFLSESDSISKVKLVVAVQDTVNEGNLNVALRDPETEEVLYADHYDISDWYDGQLISIDMGDTALEEGKFYEIVFVLSDYYADCKFCLAATTQAGNAVAGEEAYLNGERQSYWIRMDIYQ